MFIISFSEEMKVFTPIGEDDIKFWMTGPLGSYSVTITATFKDAKTLEIIVNTTTPFTGASSEYLHLEFSSKFVSKNGAKLMNNQVKGNTNEIPILPDVVSLMGSSANNLMVTTIVTIISSNIALGQS